jgi:hypothetical protein
VRVKNYTINRSLGFVRLPFNLTVDSDDLMQEERKDGIVETALANQIGAINDYEVTMFRPLFTNLTFDVFFYGKVDTTLNADIQTMLSTPYVSYYSQMKAYFANLNITTYHTFWNSFGYPFYTKKSDWYIPLPDGTPSAVLLPKRFDAQAYLYNSFIKMNFYTSPYAISQELLFQNVVYVNPRWCSLEGDAGGSWHRPTFNLNETTDGYFLYWLNNYTIDTFYVSFQFWDALNGKMINLLPCYKGETAKQWVQSTETYSFNNTAFNPLSLYLEYTMHYPSKTYSIGEFDADTNTWDMHPNPIRLYELFFDITGATMNPNISVDNGVALAPPKPPPSATEFNLWCNYATGTTGTTVPLHAPDRVVKYKSEYIPTFQAIRRMFAEDVSAMRGNTKKLVTVTNNGVVPIYLKNIVITLLHQGGSTYNDMRMCGSQRTIATDKFGNDTSSYILSSVPDYNISAENRLLQVDKLNRDPVTEDPYPFSHYYDPMRNHPDNDNYEETVAVKVVDEGKPSWESAAWMEYYYPITIDDFPSKGYDFGERLLIEHAGNDLTPIPPNGKLDLTFSLGFGKNYGYVYLEPWYYSVCDGVERFPDTDYVANLDYSVTLYFNDLTNSLPDNVLTNTVTVNVNSYYKFDYVPNPNEDNSTGGGL